MKFFAILKDSVREAVDSKVLYVMMALSGVMIFLAFSLSFKPQPGQEFFTFLVFPLNSDLTNLSPERLQGFGHLRAQTTLQVYQLKGYEPLQGAPDGPGSDFTITIQAKYAKAEDAQKVKDSPQETFDYLRSRFGSFDELHVVEVTQAGFASSNNPHLPDKPDPKDLYFELQTRPTPATVRLWPHEPSVLFGAFSLSALKNVALGLQLFVIEDKIVNGLGAWLAILLSIVITSFFIPNMLRKGTVDLLLVKPIRRVMLLVFKFLGGLVFIFLNTAFVVFGMWLAVGVRSGLWAPGFLFTIFVITFFFAILYAVSTLFAVLTRSIIVAILMTCFVWGFLFAIGLTYQWVDGEYQKEKAHAEAQGEPYSEGVFFTTVRCVHFVLPRTRDLDLLTTRLLIQDLLTANQIQDQKFDPTPISWRESLAVSGIFIVVLLGISCWWFATTDY
jgi:ABC-type transport system involved in multi-copper enzyme maturation permease subunit